jgi:uncharacterized protein YndB with AHSA1/START domain
MAPPSDPSPAQEFGLTRIFEAPRALVFKVWTDPRYVALWWGLEGTSAARCELDVRPGGDWRIDMRAANGLVFPNGGVFLEVTPGERLVYTDIPDPTSPAWAGTPPRPLLHTVSFENAERGGTRVSLSVRAHSPSDCERLLKLGMRDGISQSLDRLERLLREVNAGSDRAHVPAGGR